MGAVLFLVVLVGLACLDLGDFVVREEDLVVGFEGRVGVGVEVLGFWERAVVLVADFGVVFELALEVLGALLGFGDF